MSKKFKPKYRVFTDNKSVVKVGCRHAGNIYYGIARCNPEDEFDYDFGYALAKLRCDEKIDYEKYRRSDMWVKHYKEYIDFLEEALANEYEYYTKYLDQYLTDVEEIDKLLGNSEE